MSSNSSYLLLTLKNPTVRPCNSSWFTYDSNASAVALAGILQCLHRMLFWNFGMALVSFSSSPCCHRPLHLFLTAIKFSFLRALHRILLRLILPLRRFRELRSINHVRIHRLADSGWAYLLSIHIVQLTQIAFRYLTYFIAKSWLSTHGFAPTRFVFIRYFLSFRFRVRKTSFLRWNTASSGCSSAWWRWIRLRGHLLVELMKCADLAFFNWNYCGDHFSCNALSWAFQHIF